MGTARVILTLRNGTTLETDERYATRFPTFERFAHNIDVHVDTMIEWTNKEDKNGRLVHPRFPKPTKGAKQQLLPRGSGQRSHRAQAAVVLGLLHPVRSVSGLLEITSTLGNDQLSQV